MKFVKTCLFVLLWKMQKWRNISSLIYKVLNSNFLINVGLRHTFFSSLPTHTCFSQHSPLSVSLSTMLHIMQNLFHPHTHRYLHWHFFKDTCLLPITMWGGFLVQVSRSFTRPNSDTTIVSSIWGFNTKKLEKEKNKEKKVDKKLIALVASSSKSSTIT